MIFFWGVPSQNTHLHRPRSKGSKGSKGQDAKPTQVARFFADTVALRATKLAKLEAPKHKPAALMRKTARHLKHQHGWINDGNIFIIRIY